MAATLPRPAVLPHASGCQSCSASDRLSPSIISSSSTTSTTSDNNTNTAGSFASTTPTNNPPTPSGAKSRPPPALSPHKQQQQQHADSNMSQSVVLAHSRELEPHRPVSTSMQDITWCPMQEPPQSEDDVTRFSSPELLVAVWPTTTTTTLASTDGRGRQPPQSVSISESVETPFIHIPRCKLSVTNFDNIHQPLPAAGRVGPYPGGHGSIKIEQVALPRAVVQQFLSGIRLPNGLAGMDVDAAFPRHFDDDDEWVQSRCILSDFSELEEEEAARLSSEERLCCWGSIMLTRDGDNGWDLGFVVHRVLTQRDPVSGTCGCGRR